MSEYRIHAGEAREWFELAERPNGDSFWRCKDGTPEWVKDMVHRAHGDMLPDDWRYAFIVDALDLLDDSMIADEARDLIEADVYTDQLLQWVASNLSRIGYCDEAIADYKAEGLVAIIQVGQYIERCEVFDLVLEALLQREEAVSV